MQTIDSSPIATDTRPSRPAPSRHGAACPCPTCRRKMSAHHHTHGAASGTRLCRCPMCRAAREEAEFEGFIGDIAAWLTDTFTGSAALPYKITPGEDYGHRWRDSRPPGLPAYARKAGAAGSALSEVHSFATGQGLGDDFVRAILQMAKAESGGRYALPANTFNANPPNLRPIGKKLITAWGVFQYNRDAWTCLFLESERLKRRSYVANGTAGCSGCKGSGGCILPWDCTPKEEVEKPILQWAGLFRDIRAAGGSSGDAAGGLRLFHISPAAFHAWLRKAQASGFAAAWRGQSSSRLRHIHAFLGSAGIARPAPLPSSADEISESELELNVGSWAREYPAKVREAIAMGAAMWPLAIQRAVEAGIRNANTLANIAFFMHHPERNGRAISTSERGAGGLIEAWKFFRSAAQNLLKSKTATPSKSEPSRRNPVPQVDTLLSSTAPGLLAVKPGSLRYGLPETIEALKVIGRHWKTRHPSSARIRIRDISRKGGGRLLPHGSHRIGIDVDIDLMRNDNREARVNFKTAPAKYSRTLTQDMIDTIHANGVLKVHRLWFADQKARNVNHDKIHNDHVHVRFCVPAKYDLAAMKRAAFPGGTHGTYASC